MQKVDKKSLSKKQVYPERMGRGPRVLYITNKLRHFPDSGGARRDFELLKRLANLFEVHFVAVTPDFYEEYPNIGQTGIKFASETIVAAGREYAQTHDPLRVANHASELALDIIREIVVEFEVSLLHVNGYFLMPHVCKSLTLPIVLQEENIEWKLERDRTHVSPCQDNQTHLADYEREIEMAAWRRATQCIALTEEDARQIRDHVPTDRVHCIPNGLDPIDDLRGEAYSDDQDQPHALFVGNYSWPPSRDAAEYIVSKLWPAVRAMHPNATIKIAGSGADHQLEERLRSSPGIEYVGRYTNLRELVSRNTVFVSALRFGGGNKMKIAEAFSFGLPTVATPESMRGFAAQARDAVIVCADTPSLAKNTVKLLQSDDFRSAKSRAIINAAKALSDWDRTAEAVAKVWRSETTESEKLYKDATQTDARSTKKGM